MEKKIEVINSVTKFILGDTNKAYKVIHFNKFLQIEKCEWYHNKKMFCFSEYYPDETSKTKFFYKNIDTNLIKKPEIEFYYNNYDSCYELVLQNNTFPQFPFYIHENITAGGIFIEPNSYNRVLLYTPKNKILESDTLKVEIIYKDDKKRAVKAFNILQKVDTSKTNCKY